GDALTANSITPATGITGNIMNITASALTINIGATPTSRTYVRGANGVDFVGFTVRSGSSLDNTLKSLRIQGYIDSNTAGTFSGNGTADFATFGDTANSALKDVVDTLALYNGNTAVSDIKNVNASDGKIVFNNLNILVPRSQTINLTVRGHINNSAPYG